MRCPGRDWSDSDNSEALPGVLGTGEQRHKNKGTRGTQAILGNREHKKINILVLGNKGTRPFFRGEEGNRYPHPHWEGLNSLISIRILKTEPRPKRAD